MKRILIIDDEPLARSLLAEYLAKHQDLQVVAECANGFEGVKAIGQHKPDLVFLDVQMPKISGFEMLELLDHPPDIIFTTAFDEYAIRAFESNAVDYLLKPFTQQRFDEAIKRWRSRALPEKEMSSGPVLNPAEESSRIVVRNGADIYIVPVNEVEYIEAFDDYVKIFTRESYYLKKKTVAHYEQVLPQDKFMRVHRSFLLNLSQLTKVEPMDKNNYVAILRSGKKLPISRTGYPKLKQVLGL